MLNYSDFLIFIMEIVGTIAFASSGAMLAMRKHMDLFGVCVLGVTTAVGGGLVRDLILGIIPPSMFRNPVYTFVAVTVAIGMFLLVYMKKELLEERSPHTYDKIILVFDAVGLGIFTVVGINTARSAGYDQAFLLTFVGVLTGVGGGLLRDIMAQERPYILTKHIYACASIAGALVCVWTEKGLGNLGSMIAGAMVVMLIRFLAAHFRWNLPRIKIEE